MNDTIIPGSSAEDYRALPSAPAAPVEPAAPLIPSTPAVPLAARSPIVPLVPGVDPILSVSDAYITPAAAPSVVYSDLFSQPPVWNFTPTASPLIGSSFVLAGTATPLDTYFSARSAGDIALQATLQAQVDNTTKVLDAMDPEADDFDLVKQNTLQKNLADAEASLLSVQMRMVPIEEGKIQLVNHLDAQYAAGNATPGFQRTSSGWEALTQDGTDTSLAYAPFEQVAKDAAFGNATPEQQDAYISRYPLAWGGVQQELSARLKLDSITDAAGYASAIAAAQTAGDAVRVTIFDSEAAVAGVIPTSGSVPDDIKTSQSSDDIAKYRDGLQALSNTADILYTPEEQARHPRVLNVKEQLEAFNAVPPEAMASKNGELYLAVTTRQGAQSAIAADPRYTGLDASEQRTVVNAVHNDSNVQAKRSTLTLLLANPPSGAAGQKKIDTALAEYNDALESATIWAWDNVEVSSGVLGPRAPSGKLLDTSQAIMNSLALASFALGAYSQLYEQPRREERMYQRNRSDTIAMERWRYRRDRQFSDLQFQQAKELKQTESGGTSRGTPSGSVVSRETVI